MATAYTTNAQRTNYSRICRALIDLSSDVLREVLNVKVQPSNIKNEIKKNPDSAKLLSVDQKRYINNAATRGSYEEFDITLLCLSFRLISTQELRNALLTLPDVQTNIANCPALISDPNTKLSLQEESNVKTAVKVKSYDKCNDDLLWKLHKNLCPSSGQNIIHPSENWRCHVIPDKKYITLGDDIERIRMIRNKIYGHISNTELSDNEFNKYWVMLENVMSRMDQRMTRKQYRSSLDIIKVDCMDDVTEQKYCEEIRKMAEREKEIKHEMRNIQDDIVNIKSQRESLQSEFTNMNKEMESLKADTKQTKTDFKISKNENLEKIQKTEKDLLTCVTEVKSMSKAVDENTKKIEAVESKVVETKHEVDDIKEDLQIVKGTVLNAKEEQKRMHKKNMLQQIEKHRKDETFVITDAVYKGKDILQEHGILVFAGLPGHGKTKNALEIMKQLQDENQDGTFIELEDVREWISVIDPDDRPVVLLNDVIGKTDIVNDGDSHWRNIEARIDNGTAKVIMTIRNYLLNRNMLKLEKCKLFDGKYTIDLTSDKYKLNDDIKREIITRHCMVNGIEICNPFEVYYHNVDINDRHAVIKVDEITISDIVKTNPLIGFPLTSYLFCCKRKYTLLGATFFKKPTQYLIEEINNLVASKAASIEKVQYCIMVYMMLKDGKYESESLHSNLFNRIVKSVELQNIPTKRERKEAVELLLDRYIVKGFDSGYEFKHRTILESIAVCFYEDDPDLLMELCSKEFIEDFVRPEAFEQAEGEVVCKVERKVYDTLINRFLDYQEHRQNEGKEVKEYKWLIKHPIMDDEQFVDLFMDKCKSFILDCSKDMFQLACTYGKTYYLDKLYILCTKANICFENRNLYVYKTLIHKHIDTAMWLLSHNFVTKYDLFWSFSLPNPYLIKHFSVALEDVICNLERLCVRSDSEVVKAIFSRWPDLKEEHVLKMFECFILYGNPIECVDALITCRPDIVTEIHMKEVFLWACVGLFNNIEMMDYLLSIYNHKNINNMLVNGNRENLTYLHFAAFFGRLDVCIKLLSLGCQLDDRTKSGLNVLQMVILGYCCRSTGAHVSSVRSFCQESNSVYSCGVEEILKDKSEILTYYCQLIYQKLENYNLVGLSLIPASNYTQLFEYINARTVINKTDYNLTIDALGNKLVHYCVLYDDIATLKMLHNIDSSIVHAVDVNGLSSLHIAAVFGKLDIFMKLVEFGLCVPSRICDSGLSVLQLAMIGFTYQGSSINFWQHNFLIDQSISINYYCSKLHNRYGDIANYEQIIKFLVEHKDCLETDLNIAVDIYGHSLEHYCVVYNSLHIIQLLGRKSPGALSGQNVITDKRFYCVSTKRLMTPLELSILMGRNEIFQYLLSRGTDKDINRLTELLAEGKKYAGSELWFYDNSKPYFLQFLEYGDGRVLFGSDRDYTSISEVIQKLHDENSR